MRQMVSERHTYDGDYTVGSLRDWLQQWDSNLPVDFNSEYDWNGCGHCFWVETKRPETDEELNTRIAKEKERIAQRAIERERYKKGEKEALLLENKLYLDLIPSIQQAVDLYHTLKHTMSQENIDWCDSHLVKYAYLHGVDEAIRYLHDISNKEKDND